MGCSSRGLSTRSRRRRRPGHCIGGLIRSLPDSLPRVVARYRPASKCFLPGRRRYDVAYREELSRNVHRRRGVHVCHRGRYPPRDPLVALISATTGAVVDQSVFPTTPSGLDRALTWITRMVGNDSVLVVIEGIGSYGAGLAERIGDAGLLVAEPAAMPAGQRRGGGKNDAPDAGRIARSGLGVDSSRLRWPRATGPRVVLRVLVVAREQMVAEHTRAINALTALLRTIDLGIDTRKALSHSQFKVVVAWRDRREDSVVRTCRQEAIRLAKRIVALDGELVDNRKALDAAVEETAPELCELPGVGSVVAASVLTAWSHPGRVRSEAAFAALAGTCPIPASSGNTLRHRLNRGRSEEHTS